MNEIFIENDEKVIYIKNKNNLTKITIFEGEIDEEVLNFIKENMYNDTLKLDIALALELNLKDYSFSIDSIEVYNIPLTINLDKSKYILNREIYENKQGKLEISVNLPNNLDLFSVTNNYYYVFDKPENVELDAISSVTIDFMKSENSYITLKNNTNIYIKIHRIA